MGHPQQEDAQGGGVVPHISEIPIVGQPVKVLQWWPTALIECRCKPGQQVLIVLAGVGNWTRCPLCGKLHAISAESKLGAIDVHTVVGPPTQ